MGLAPSGLARDEAAVGVGLQKRPPQQEGTNARAAVLFLLPALVLLAIFIVYPAIYTILLSFDRGRRGQFTQNVGLQNYQTLFTSDPNFLDLSHFPPSGALFNNVLWIVFYTFFVIFFGLIIAVTASRVRYESIIKAVVFLPMAIAATALAVIWGFVYAPDAKTGLLNAVIGVAGINPISWLGDPGFVNAALIAVGVWGSVGFATVILSAAIKSISSEVIEAARVDGASERTIFRRIIVPMVSLPISVLAVTLIVNVVKLFDLIYVMTNGGPGTSSRVIAFTMYQESFPGGLFGKGAAVAVVMLLILIPVMIFNVRRFRTESVT
ncbi:MAG: alpha-glucoside transport system permease protein [Chloroflexota bacterium]|nr:alpha-glucoside transport system permease protein [Chloroflexota bacterium]